MLLRARGPVGNVALMAPCAFSTVVWPWTAVLIFHWESMLAYFFESIAPGDGTETYLGATSFVITSLIQLEPPHEHVVFLKRARMT